MKLLLNVSNPAEYNGFFCAWLDLTPELALKILRRMDALKALSEEGLHEGLQQLCYYDCEVLWLNSYPPNPATGEEYEFDGEDYLELPETSQREGFENFAERTECNRMQMSADYVWWRAYPKHCDRKVETWQIERELLEKVAA